MRCGQFLNPARRMPAMPAGGFCLLFALNFTRVPTAQGFVADPSHGQEERDTGERDQQESGKHAGNVELKARLQNLISEA